MASDIASSSVMDSTTIKQYDYEILLERLKNELSKFCLTANQSKVFLYLEKYGPITATQISKTLKVPRTETYHLLTNLQNKGIVTASFQHPIKFSAISLDKAIGILINSEKERVRHLESQEKSLVELWGTIPSLNITPEDVKDGKFQILQGLNQMTGKIDDMICNAKKDIQILASEKDFMKFYHAGFLERIRDSKVNPQFVSSTSEKTTYIFKGKLEDKVRRMPLKVKEDLCFIIKDDDALFLFLKNPSGPPQNILAMWTDSKSMVYTLNLLFAYIWSNSRRI